MVGWPIIIYTCPHYGLCGQPLAAGECMPECIKRAYGGG